MAGADLESRQLITDLLKFANAGSGNQTKAAGMKTTLIAGYPVLLVGRCGSALRLTTNGVTKATLCLPYFQNPNVAMTKFSGATSLETPLDMVASEIVNPYNCKLGVTPGLDIGKLVSGECYYFCLQLSQQVLIRVEMLPPTGRVVLKLLVQRLTTFLKITLIFLQLRQLNGLCTKSL
jgi:hypothetical protein